jgi:hypothetical protein
MIKLTTGIYKPRSTVMSEYERLIVDTKSEKSLEDLLPVGFALSRSICQNYIANRSTFAQQRDAMLALDIKARGFVEGIINVTYRLARYFKRFPAAYDILMKDEFWNGYGLGSSPHVFTESILIYAMNAKSHEQKILAAKVASTLHCYVEEEVDFDELPKRLEANGEINRLLRELNVISNASDIQRPEHEDGVCDPTKH